MQCAKYNTPRGGLGVCSPRKFFGSLGPLSTSVIITSINLWEFWGGGELVVEGGNPRAPPLCRNPGCVPIVAQYVQVISYVATPEKAVVFVTSSAWL